MELRWLLTVSSPTTSRRWPGWTGPRRPAPAPRSPAGSGRGQPRPELPAAHPGGGRHRPPGQRRVDDYHKYDRAERRKLAVHPAASRLQLHTGHGAAPAAARQGPADPQAGLRPPHRGVHPPGAGRAASVRHHRGTPAAAHQARPRLLRRDRLPGPTGRDPAGLEGQPGHRGTRLHGSGGAGRTGTPRRRVPRPLYSRSARSRTSSSGSRPSRAASCRRARRCPPS